MLQIQNLATKTLQGKLDEGLADSLIYIQTRQKIDAENLALLSQGLLRSRERLMAGIGAAFTTPDASVEERLSQLEDVLLQADIGVTTTAGIIEDLRAYSRTEGLKEQDILPVLRERLVQALTSSQPANIGAVQSAEQADGIQNEGEGQSFSPRVVLVIGANGMGKTTTIGKLAARLRQESNATVLLGACDTHRPAAGEQLRQWALRANASIELPNEGELGGSPVPVVSRTLQRARREGCNVVLLDTSGRLSNNFELIEELQAMKAAVQAADPTAPHETLLVVDAALGRNAVDQAAAWRRHVGVTGLVVTKLDGTARGGFLVSVVRDLGLSVKFVGVGERVQDLREFQPEVFVDALLGNAPERARELKAAAERILGISSANTSGKGRTGGGGGRVDALQSLRQALGKDGGRSNSDKVRSPQQKGRALPKSGKRRGR